MILDSNIVIYLSSPANTALRAAVNGWNAGVSAITCVEVLGYHSLTPDEKRFYEEFFDRVIVFPISDALIAEPIRLRQDRKRGLGDSIIAATSLVHARTLVTRNIADFTGIAGLTLLDPMAPAP